MKIMYRGNRKFGIVIVCHQNFGDFLFELENVIEDDVDKDEIVDIIDTESDWDGENYHTVTKYAILKDKS